MQVMSSAGMPRPPQDIRSNASPRSDMDNRISAALEAGSISETDATALESALDSIDSALGWGSSSAASSKLDPSDMKGRIDSLISSQVDAGTLTADQAAELQGLFAQGPSGAGGPADMAAAGDGTSIAGIDGSSGVNGMQAMGGPGGPRGPGGPPPPPPSSSDDSSDSSSSDDSSLSVDDVLTSMQAFMDNLRASLASGSTYSASSSTTSAASGLIVDQLA